MPTRKQSTDTSSLFVVHGSYAMPSTWKKPMERMALSHHCIAIRLPCRGLLAGS